MKVVIQRVSKASLTIDDTIYNQIGLGFVILLGIENNDTEEDVNWLVQKIVKLRVFSDDNGKMNLDIQQLDGEILVVSQFTLHAMTHKGNRPSFIKAARPEVAIPLYNKFISTLENHLPQKIKTGKFGADMKIELVNDGPVTIIIDSKEDESV
jgi:D-tyrosyl-tRNA(Tyr) deacylase